MKVHQQGNDPAVASDIEETIGMDSTATDESMVSSSSSFSPSKKEEVMIGGEKKGNNNKSSRHTRPFKKIFLVPMLVLLMAGVIVLVCRITTKNANDSELNKIQYENAANKLVEAFLEIPTKLQAVNTLAVAFEFYGRDHYRSWPFLTFHNMEKFGASARSQSGSLLIHANHYIASTAVQQHQREDWEAFTTLRENYWIPMGLEYQESVDMYENGGDEEMCKDLGDGALQAAMALQKNYTEGPHNIWKQNPLPLTPVPIWQRAPNNTTTVDGVVSSVPVTGPGPYLVRWESSPILCNGNQINEEVTIDMGDVGGNISFHSQTVTFGKFQLAPPTSSTGNHLKDDSSTTSPISKLFSLLLSIQKGEFVDYLGDPMNQVYFPIFDGSYNRKTVAVLTAWIHWSFYFQNILDQSNNMAIYLVLHNSCSGSFTYIVNGNNKLVPVGVGDHHDTRHDAQKISAAFDPKMVNFQDGTKYGVPLNDKYCTISLDVYPSTKF